MNFCNSCMEPYGEDDRCPKCGYSGSDPVEEGNHLPIGRVIKERYMIGKVLESGAFGSTYIGWDRNSNHKVSIKEYLPSEFATRVPRKDAVTMFSEGKKQKQFHDGLVKFTEEAEKLRQLPPGSGVVQVLDNFNFNNTAYIVSEFLEGETLAHKLEHEISLPPDEAVSLILPIIHSLKMVHSQGMIHSDICPKNIIITTGGRGKLINFAAYRTATTSHSRSMSVVVNTGYSAEEQYRSRSDQGPYTDVYSLGAVLYHMVTGVPPPDAFERRISYEHHKRDIIKPLRGIPANQAAAIMNALNVRIEDRTSDTDSLARELTSDTKVFRRRNQIDAVNDGKLKKGTIAVSAVALVFIFTLLAMGADLFGTSSPAPLPDGMCRVPSVIGQNLTMAETALSDAGLQLLIHDKQYSGEVPADYILLQDIKAGTVVDTNTVVSVTVSGGQEMELVPLVEGETIQDARKMLESLGFVVSAEKTPSLYRSEGIVFSQDIKANTEVAVGATITLKVSSGEIIKGVAYIETVPNLVGLTLAEAADRIMALARAGNIAGKPFGIDAKVSKDYSKTIPAGHIMSQNLKAGTQEMTDKSFKFTLSQGVHYVMMPDVQFRPLAKAMETLKLGGESRFKINVTEVTDENVIKGHVISQDPSGGTKVEFDSPVLLRISQGPRGFQMPNVERKTKAEAVAELNKNGITNIVYKETRKDDFPQGSVVSQSPRAGTVITGKTNVELLVSIGKILRRVPDVTRHSRIIAEQIIRQACLTARVNEEYSNTVPQGFVLSQNPTAGELETGSEVVITVSKGTPESIIVPEVTNKTEDDARFYLESKGFVVHVQYEESTTTGKGKVVSQEPLALATAPRGSKVTINVSLGIQVPNVVGKTENEAKSLLLSRDLKPTVKYDQSSAIPEGIVFEQTLVFEYVDKQTQIMLYVSSGTVVPNVMGFDQSDAEGAIQNVGLQVIVNEQESSTVPKGKVMSQNPVGGTGASAGDSVTITVSSGMAVIVVTGVTINTDCLELEAGATEQLMATVIPANAANRDVFWSSSDTSVATVSSDGLVSAVTVGTAKITVTTADGGFTSICTVDVT